MDGFMTIDVVKGNQDIPYQLKIKNKSFDLDFYLSSDDLIPSVPDIAEPDEYEIEFDLDDLMLPYKFDISIYDKITNPKFLEHINRVGKEFYKRKQQSENV